MQIVNEEKFQEGDYLWVLSNPKAETGVWKIPRSVIDDVNYQNGKETTGNHHAYQILNKSSGLLFWDQIAFR